MPTEKGGVGNSSLAPRLRRGPAGRSPAARSADSRGGAAACAGTCSSPGPAESEGAPVLALPAGATDLGPDERLRGTSRWGGQEKQNPEHGASTGHTAPFFQQIDFKGKTERKRKLID